MTVAIALGDPTVEIVDPELGALVPADHTTLVDRFAFGVEMAAGALTAAPLHIPAPVGVRHHMVCVWPLASRHICDPFRFWKIKNTPTPNLELGARLRVVKVTMCAYSELYRFSTGAFCVHTPRRENPHSAKG